MAIRSKTIEYLIPMCTSSVASGSICQLTPITIYIPETGSRVITNAFIESHVRDYYPTTTGRANINSQSYYLFSSHLSSGYTSSFNRLYADSGEQISITSNFLVTPYLTASFANNVVSCSFSASYIFSNTPASQSYNVINIAPKLYITYQFDDTSTGIRAKTVTIPLNNTGSINTTNLSIAPRPDVIPALDTYCPEISKSFDCIWLEFETQDQNDATTDHALTMSLDAGNAFDGLSGKCVNPNNTGIYGAYRFSLNNLATGSTHTVKLSAGNALTYYNDGMLLLKATYRYNHDQSQTILNSVSVASDNRSSDVYFGLQSTEPGPYAWNYSTINIQEPGTIRTKNCGLIIATSVGAAANTIVYVGNRTSSFGPTTNDPSLNAGGIIRCTRIDGQNTNILTQYTKSISPTGQLQRGENILRWFGTDSSVSSRTSWHGAEFILNYESTKSIYGADAHNHTLTECTIDTTISGASGTGTGNKLVYNQFLPVSIAEPYYYINGCYISNYIFCNGNSGGAPIYLGVEVTGSDGRVRNLFNEDTVIGFINCVNGDNENGIQLMYFDLTKDVDRFPNFWEQGMDVKNVTTRRLRTWNAYPYMPRTKTTYHSITYAISGSLSGYTGDGSGIIIECIESGSGHSKIFRTTSTTGGNYAGIVYDNTVNYYTTALQDVTHVGRSVDATGSLG